MLHTQRNETPHPTLREIPVKWDRPWNRRLSQYNESSTQAQTKAVKELGEEGSNLWSELSYHSGGSSLDSPRNRLGDCLREASWRELTYKGERNRTEQRKKFNCDAVAKGALAHPSGR